YSWPVLSLTVAGIDAAPGQAKGDGVGITLAAVFEHGRFAKQCLQSGLGVTQGDPVALMLTFRGFRCGILHQKIDKVILGRYFYPDDTTFRPWLNAVIN